LSNSTTPIRESGHELDPVQLRRPNSGNKREVTVAAVVSAAALAWTITSAWVGFRDGVQRSVFDLNVRVEALAVSLEGDRKLGAERIERIARIEQQIGKIADAVGTLRDGVERRMESLHPGKD
jgi:hypothetical protein